MVVTPALASGPSRPSTNSQANVIGGNGPPDHAGSGGPPGRSKAPNSPGRGNSNVTIANETYSANTSTGALFEAARKLSELEPDSQAGRNAVNTTLESINASLKESRSFRRANSEASFEHLKDAQKRLKTVAKETENETAVRNVSRLLYEASALNAKRAIFHAEFAFDRHKNAFPNYGQQRKTDQAVINAKAAFNRGSSAATDETPRRGPPKDSLKGAIQSNANAITHYRTAWRHAERALVTIAEHTEPRLTLRQRHAFEENGSIRVILGVELSDVRAHAFDEANVSLESGTAAPVRFGPQLTVSSTRGSTVLDLGPEPENQTVTVTATSTDDPSRSVNETLDINLTPDNIFWDLPAPDEHARAEVTDEESGVSVAVEGGGVHESLISVQNQSSASASDDLAGPMVRITNETSFDQAEVTIPIDEGALERTDGNLSIHKWDPSTDGRWHKVETEIDAANLTATANVSSFSFFTVLESSFIPSTGDKTALEWPQLEDFESTAGWDQAGNVSVADGHATLASEAENSTGGGGIGGGGDDGDGGDGGDGGDTGDDPPEVCLPIVGCWSVPWLPFSTASTTETAAEVATQESGESTRLTRTFEIPAGAERVWFETRASSTVSEGSTAIVVTGESDTEVIDVNEQGSTGWQTHEADLSAFADEEVTVQFETRGTAELTVDYVGTLVDSTGSGFPDEVEKLDLRMSTGLPFTVGKPLNLDPTKADTSGNGLRDSEVVDIEWRYEEYDAGKQILAAEVDSAKAHPARIDTTGDGLTDAEQLDGWQISYTSSREDSLDFLSELQNAESVDELEDPEGNILETETVFADPLLNGSDSDGVADTKEVRLGTDPQSRDTTGDGISDGRIRNGEYDPTLFDINSPEIIVTYASFNDPNVETPGWDPRDWDARVSGSYDVEFVVTDPAGLDEARVVRDGNVEEAVSLNGIRDDASVTFDVGTVDTFTDAFIGTQVTVQADDRHEVVDGVGSTEVAAVEVGGVWAAASEEIRSQGVSNVVVEKNLGTLQGMTTGAGKSIDSLRALYNDPIGSITALREIPAAILNFRAIIAAMPQSIEDKQKQNNPHDPDENPKLYQSYRMGWYEGYIAWFVIESSIPAGKAGKAVKSSKRFQKVAGSISTPKIRRAAKLATRAKRGKTTALRYGKLQFSRGLSTGIGVTKKTGERILSPVPTIGKQYQVSKLLSRHDIDATEIDRLDADGQEAIGNAIARSGNDAGRAMADGGPDPVARAYQLDLDVDNEDLVSNLFRHSTEVDFERVIDNLEELNRPGADIEGVDALAKRLKSGGRSNVKGAAFEAEVAVDRGTDSVEAIGKSNPYSRGEIDIETTDGRVIETKSGDYTQARKGSDRYTDLENQIGHYQQYTAVEGGTIEVVFRKEPHGDIKDMLNTNNVEAEIYNE